jgi:thymidylate synthase
MIFIEAKSTVEAWRQALTRLVREGEETDNQTYFRDEFVVIELSNPALEPSHPLFPMQQADLDTINDFIHSGANEEQVVHAWTVMYYHRMFDEPNSQIRYVLDSLSQREPLDKTVMCLWDKTIDQKTEVAPCTLEVWARKRFGKLDFHVHAHSSDAYGKLLMNLQEFVSLHLYLAGQLKLQPGKYVHILDSCHIHRPNELRAREVADALLQ